MSEKRWELVETVALGARNKGQSSIGEKVDILNVTKIYLSCLDRFKNIVEELQDAYAKELFKILRDEKKINFPVNKHMEVFIKNNKIDKDKIIKYLIFRYKFFSAGRKKINLGYPPYLLIEPVSTCNLRCPFCFQTDKSFTRKPFMGVIDFDFFKKIVDEADKLKVGAITLASRGEPTMHKNFINMLQYINEKENIFELKVNTNGTYLNESICRAIFENNVTQIVISSDHYIKEDYERLRKGSNFEKVVANVDMLYKIREEYYPNSATEIRISGIDNERNLNRIRFKNFWIKRADHVSAAYPSERWDTYKNEKLPNITDPCQNLWDRMYIWFDGKVNPCDVDYKSYLSYGNANENSLKKLWNNKVIGLMRKDHLSENRCKIVPCDRCDMSFV